VAAALAARPPCPWPPPRHRRRLWRLVDKRPRSRPPSPTRSRWSPCQAARTAAAAGAGATADAKYREAEKAELTLDTVKEHVALLVKHDRAADAVGVAKGYYEAKPSDSNGSLVYANALIAAGDFTTAVEIAGEVVDLQGTNPAGFDARGRALVGAGRADEGLEDLRKAVELAPQEFEYVLAYGIGLEKAQKIDEAALTLRSALNITKDEPRALMHLGIVRRAQFEVKEGVGYLMQAVRLDPNLAEAWFNLAIAQNDMGDNVEAENSAAKAAALAPHVGTYAYVYGEMLRINKKVDEAKAAYQKALDATPPHPRPRSSSRWCCTTPASTRGRGVLTTCWPRTRRTPASTTTSAGLPAPRRSTSSASTRSRSTCRWPPRTAIAATAEIKSLKKKGGIR
jgi:tetratricopeptide (TPR) repeat protein